MNISQSLIRMLGSRYMPANAVHFSDLDVEQQADMVARAPILTKNHFDWLFFKIPRTWTTWWVPYPARKARGNADEWIWDNGDGEKHLYCKPIPEPGQWFQNPGRTDDIVGYRASTDYSGKINRSGARFDDVDNYMTYPSFRAGSITDFLRNLF